MLSNVSLKVPAGSSLAVVGATGSGKSTLVELLLRMYAAPPGTLLLDGVDIGRYRLADLRGAIGYVPQETFLFSDTVAANIGYGANGASEEAVLAAAGFYITGLLLAYQMLRTLWLVLGLLVFAGFYFYRRR